MSTEWGGGKGSKPRPLTSTYEEYAKRWDAIFKKEKKVKIEEQNQHEKDFDK